MPTPAVPPKDAFARLLDGLQTFMKEHLALAKAEAKDELRAFAADLAMSAAGVPLLFTGYLLLMVALGLLLALVLPSWAAFGLVALVNLGAGGLLTFVWGRRMAKQRPGLRGTGQELSRDKEWLSQLPGATRAGTPLPAAKEASLQGPLQQQPSRP